MTDNLPDKLPKRLPDKFPDIDPREGGIDRLLRRSLAAQVPALPPDFDQRLRREPSQASSLRDRYRRILLPSYALISVAVSAVVMRGQGLDWGPIAVMILAPLALIATIPLARRAIHTSMRHNTK